MNPKLKLFICLGLCGVTGYVTYVGVGKIYLGEDISKSCAMISVCSGVLALSYCLLLC